MKVLLTSGKYMIGKILQPAISAHGEKVLKKNAPKSQKDTLGIGVNPRIDEEINFDSNFSKMSTKKNFSVHKAKTFKNVKEKKAEHYVGPLRNIPKKNWKKKPGGIGLNDPVPQDLFFESQNAPWKAWEISNNQLSPVEILLGLGRCLNEAASLTISPSGQHVNLDHFSFNSDFFENKSPLLFKKSARRFDVQGDYNIRGKNINIPLDPFAWNIYSNLPVWLQKRKRALGLCLQLNNNTAFIIMTPRYTQEGKVKRSHAIVQDLEAKCASYPNTFLSSMFIPG
ncbi:hypothetical protein [Holospora obtusa]|nr:hypothetical protein [Holospora obtusa]